MTPAFLAGLIAGFGVVVLGLLTGGPGWMVACLSMCAAGAAGYAVQRVT